MPPPGISTLCDEPIAQAQRRTTRAPSGGSGFSGAQTDARRNRPSRASQPASQADVAPPHQRRGTPSGRGETLAAHDAGIRQASVAATSLTAPPAGPRARGTKKGEPDESTAAHACREDAQQSKFFPSPPPIPTPPLLAVPSGIYREKAEGESTEMWALPRKCFDGGSRGTKLVITVTNAVSLRGASCCSLAVKKGKDLLGHWPLPTARIFVSRVQSHAQLKRPFAGLGT